MIAIASIHGHRNLKRIERACRNHHTRQSIGFFLTKGPLGCSRGPGTN